VSVEESTESNQERTYGKNHNSKASFQEVLLGYCAAIDRVNREINIY
jgi:hypothetical protein